LRYLDEKLKVIDQVHNYQGKEVKGKPVDFLIRKEDIEEYQLTDGKILKN